MQEQSIRSTLAEPFIEGLSRNVIRLQLCTSCGRAQTLARYACHYCGAQDLRWRDALGSGTVQAATIVARAPSDDFRPLVPYTLVVVQLDEGARLMGHASPGVHIGSRVQAEFFQHRERTLVRFTLVANQPVSLETPKEVKDGSP